MTDKGRRIFCKRYLLQQFGRVAAGFDAGLREAEEDHALDAFFDSYESSYSLTLAYPDELLMDTARQHGIATEGREKNAIVKELIRKHGGYGHRNR